MLAAELGDLALIKKLYHSKPSCIYAHAGESAAFDIALRKSHHAVCDYIMKKGYSFEFALVSAAEIDGVYFRKLFLANKDNPNMRMRALYRLVGFIVMPGEEDNKIDEIQFPETFNLKHAI